MADQDAVAAFKVEGDVDQITLHTKQAIANPSIPIQASSLERLVTHLKCNAFPRPVNAAPLLCKLAVASNCKWPQRTDRRVARRKKRKPTSSSKHAEAVLTLTSGQDAGASGRYNSLHENLCLYTVITSHLTAEALAVCCTTCQIPFNSVCLPLPLSANPLMSSLWSLEQPARASAHV